MPLFTPVPLYVPPLGLPPLKTTGAESKHISAKSFMFTTGNGLTVICVESLLVQAFASVYV